MTGPTHTKNAASLGAMQTGIRLIERMPALAMRFARIARCGRVSPEKVNPDRHRIKMVRVDASPVSTEMINRQSGRNRPFPPFICPSMCESPTILGRAKASVTAVVEKPNPEPASVVQELDPFHEALIDAQIRIADEYQGIPVPTPSLVMPDTESADVCGAITSLNRATSHLLRVYQGGDT